MQFFDSSSLSEFRNGKTTLVNSEKIEFLESMLEKFQLSIDDVLLTERLFTETIGYGGVRHGIKKNNREKFDAEKRKILALLRKNLKDREEGITLYITFLESFFHEELKKNIPQATIYTTTINQLKEYSFIEKFRSFETKVIHYSEELTNKNSEYDNLIKILVEDSVVRYALDAIDIRQTHPNMRESALEILNQTLTILMVKYYHSEILYSNLNLLMSALKRHIDGKSKPQEKSQPLLRVDDDLVDVELGHFPIRGKTVGNKLVPITVLTIEPEHGVKERLKYNFQAIGTKSHIVKPQKLVLGRTIILDFKNYSHVEILTGKYIYDNFKTLSGEPIFQEADFIQE